MDSYRDLSSVYDELINEDVNYEEWAKFILDKCDKYEVYKDTYLDLACGTGNLTQFVSQDFKKTWAVDLSPYMLSKAEEKLRGKRIKFICQDITQLNLKDKFNLVTCCLDGTNYILDSKDILKFFKNVYNHLNEDGIFIFDINSYYKLKEILGNNIFNYDDGEIVYIWENVYEDNIVNMYLTFFIKDGEMYNRFDESHREKAYTNEEIEGLLLEAGFKLKERLDSYSNLKASETSERIVFIAQK